MEFRRRVKTQGSLPTEDAALVRLLASRPAAGSGCDASMGSASRRDQSATAKRGMTCRELAPGSRSTGTPMPGYGSKSRLSGSRAPSYAEPSRFRVGAVMTVPRRVLTVLLTIALLAAPLAAEAQAGRVPRIGILELASPSASVRGHKAFQQGLRELGYVEGKNIILEYRYADGKPDLLPQLAADLVRLKVDAIVTRSTAPIRAAKNASTTIPIVFTNAGAPVEDGLVSSLARPGGNVKWLTRPVPGARRKEARATQAGLSRGHASGLSMDRRQRKRGRTRQRSGGRRARHWGCGFNPLG